MTVQEACAQAFENGRRQGDAEGYARGKAEAVKHGRWETNCDPEECEKDFYCSVCEELICDFDTTALYPGENCYYYCPNCGARMDGDGDA